MAVKTDNRLGCGRDIDEVWAHGDEPPNDHESTCPHCQVARQSLSDLHNATDRLLSEDLADPSLHLAEELLNKVSAIARSEVRRGARVPLVPGGTSSPTLTISEQAIATVIRHTSDQIPGVETRHCTLKVVEDAHTNPPVRVSIAIRLTISVSARLSIIDQVAHLRERLVDAIDVEIGVNTASIDILVEDLHDA